MGDATAEVEYSIKQAAPTVNDSIIGLGGYDVKCFFYPKNEYSWAYAGSPTDVGTYVVRFKVQGNGNYAYTSERLMDESWKNQTKVIEGSTLTKAATIAVDSLRYGGTGGGICASGPSAVFVAAVPAAGAGCIRFVSGGLTVYFLTQVC